MFLLVCTVVLVPAAFRATQHVNHTASTALRLNRGFDMPVEKQRVRPADLPSLLPAAIARQETTTAFAIRRAADPDDALPASPDLHCPDPLRGPPSPLV